MTTVIVSQLSFPGSELYAVGNLSVAGKIIVESWNQIEIANLSVVSDSEISVSVGPLIPFVGIGGKWENRLVISVAGTVLPKAVQLAEEIPIICFREMPCVINDLVPKLWNDEFELNCSDNCAVIKLHDDLPTPHNSNEILYIIIGAIGGIIIIIIIITMIICIRRHKAKTLTDGVFTPFAKSQEPPLHTD
jgi:hypothetical protein